MKTKKLVLDFHPVKNPPEIDGMYFVLFKVQIEKRIEYHYGFAEFDQESGWSCPEKCTVNQWCALPSSKILL